MHANAVSALRRGSQIGPRATRERRGPWLLIDADSQHSFLNVAVLVAPAGDAEAAIAVARSWFGSRGRSFCYLLREDVDAAVVAALRLAGKHVDHRLPALVMEPLTPPCAALDSLEVTEVHDPRELEVYAGIGGEDQGLPKTLMRSIAHTAYASGGFVLLVGRHHGTAVATSLALVTGELVGVYNVNVAPAVRRRGIGTAMTWAAIERGRRQGCVAAFLESTPMSHRLYERIGFRTVYSYLQMGG